MTDPESSGNTSPEQTGSVFDLIFSTPPYYSGPISALPAANSINHKGHEVTQRKNGQVQAPRFTMIFAAKGNIPAFAFPAYLCALCSLCGEGF